MQQLPNLIIHLSLKILYCTRIKFKKIIHAFESLPHPFHSESFLRIVGIKHFFDSTSSVEFPRYIYSLFFKLLNDSCVLTIFSSHNRFLIHIPAQV
jgi:hypothetical protein